MRRCPHCTAEVQLENRFCGRCGKAVEFSSEYSTVALPRGAAARLNPIATPDDDVAFPPGTVLSQRYRVMTRLGKGGMAEVYRASDMLLGQTVALKFLPESLARNQAALDRLRGEVRLARQISHPNVCRVYDLGEAEGQVFLTMEFIDGEDLASLLRRIGRLPQGKALEIARRLCAGLAAAHEKGVLHRDLKPANIMIDSRGQVLITDFGLATAAGAVNPADVRSGTPAYMSPEQLAGVDVTYRSDIYSLGLVFYEIFTGERAYPASTREELQVLRREGPRPMTESTPDINPETDRVVARCLEPNPANRPSAALAVAAALPGGDPIADALAAGDTPSPEMVAAAEPGDRMRPQTAAACFAILAIACLLAARLSATYSVFAPLDPGIDGSMMVQTARDVIAGLGYSDKAPWSEGSFAYDGAALNRLRRLSAAAAHQRVIQDKPVFFFYRAGPGPLAGTNPSSYAVTETAPPVSAPGMILVRLTPDRRLRSFTAIPPERVYASASPPFDWMKLFAAAHLDQARFVPASPIWAPPTAFDAQAAWLERGAANPVRVEAAAWRGRPTFFRIDMAADLSRTEGAVQRDSSAPASAPSLSPFVVFNLLSLVLVSVLAWHNLRRARGDLAGACRFGLFIGVTTLVSDLLQVSHSLDIRGYRLLVTIWGSALFWGANTALAYLALEPLVRRRWPYALISWTRFVNGKLRDPAVAQHILVGVTFGAIWGVSIAAYQSFVLGIVNPWRYLVSSSPAHVVAGLLYDFLNAASEAFPYCLLLFAIALCRSRWAGAGVMVVTMSLVSADPNHWVWSFTVLALMWVAGAIFALRYGLLAVCAAGYASSMFGLFPLTLDASSFYFGTSLAALLSIVGVGVYAYRYAVGGQRLRT
jgi:tRNA A-37 threonylcarbamoyl transferase component Bud32